MARPKHSTALFEVISREQRNGRSRAGLLGSVSRWFGGGGGGVEPIQPVAEISSHPRAEPGPGSPGAPEGEGWRPGRIELDGDRYELTLRVSYTSAIICGFAVLTLVGASFIAGRKMVGGVGPAFAADTTEQLRAGLPAAGVLDLEAKAVDLGPPPPEAEGVVEASPPGPVGSAPRDRNRVAGLNYVVIQSYGDQEMAAEAVKLLAENGIDCTVEHKLPGWGNWYVVVGLEGFDRISRNPRYDAYVRKIREISNRKYPGTGKKTSFKAFEPTGFLWGKK